MAMSLHRLKKTTGFGGRQENQTLAHTMLNLEPVVELEQMQTATLATSGAQEAPPLIPALVPTWVKQPSITQRRPTCGTF